MSDFYVNPGDATEARNHAIDIQEQIARLLIDLLARLKAKQQDKAAQDETQFDEFDNQRIAATSVALVEAYGVEQADGSRLYQAEDYSIEMVRGDELGNFYFVRDRQGEEIFTFQTTQEESRRMIAQVSDELVQRGMQPANTPEIPQMAEMLIQDLGQNDRSNNRSSDSSATQEESAQPPSHRVKRIVEKPKKRQNDFSDRSSSTESTASQSSETSTPISSSLESPLNRVAAVSDGLIEQQGIEPPQPTAIPESPPRRYKAEMYSIEANDDNYSIKDLKGQEIFSFQKRDEGYVILTDKMTVEQKQDFLKAYDAIQRSGGIENVAQQPLKSQIDSLDNLAPSGARAAAFAHDFLDGTNQNAYQGKSYRFERDQQGLSIKNEHGIEILHQKPDGQLNSQLASRDVDTFRQLYESDSYKQLQRQVANPQVDRQPVAAATRSSTPSLER